MEKVKATVCIEQFLMD